MEQRTRGIIRIILFIVFFPFVLLVGGIVTNIFEGAFTNSRSTSTSKRSYSDGGFDGHY